MALQDILAVIVEHGTSVVLMAYFLFKDWKISQQQTALLSEIKQMLSIVQERVIALPTGNSNG